MPRPKAKKIQKGKERQYDHSSLLKAARLVRYQNLSLYRAAKETGVPWSTLKDFLSRSVDIEHATIPKLGRPFTLPPELEIKVFHHINTMQELGFGLTVVQVRKLAYDLAKSVNREKLFNPDKQIASKWWWSKFKERYNLTLRTPENLSAYRASMANATMIDDYFSKLELLLTKLDIMDKPDRLWNVDETGLTFVVKSGKVVSQIGKRFIYKRTYAERGETHTLVGCICANGTFIPPFVIFKGVRWSDDLGRNALPNSVTRLSPKGWINESLFKEWFEFFISSIPARRPVVLLMDSHSSHINPDVISLARENGIYLFTFPAHTSHLLQPLDVGVYKPLKSHWSKALNNYMLAHPTEKPTRQNFHEIFSEPFISSMTPMNIINAFKKAGVYPCNRAVIPAEALRPSMLTEQPAPDQQLQKDSTPEPPTPGTSAAKAFHIADKILELPTVPKKEKSTHKKKGDSRARLLTPFSSDLEAEEPTASSSTSSCALSTSKAERMTAKSKSLPKLQKTENDSEEDWICGKCKIKFSEDVKKKTGASWVQCSFCLVPYHTTCQEDFLDEEDIYMCNICETIEKNSEIE